VTSPWPCHRFCPPSPHLGKKTTTGEGSNLPKRRGVGSNPVGCISFLSIVFFGMKFDGIFLEELPSVKDMKGKGWMTGNCQLSFSDQIYKSCLESTSRKAELRNSYVKRESENKILGSYSVSVVNMLVNQIKGCIQHGCEKCIL